MTSYVYNPSQKVTEILSKFLEFDPAQLELGIWSGDLSLSNVNLREDAVYPLLNIAANKPHTDPFTKAPLHMKLVSGTVGHMRIRIPWKRLVWGQGDVQMEISDVSIVLAYENREDVKVDKGTGPQSKETNEKSFGAPDKPKVSKSYRDAKQRRLNEAERRHMKGMPMSLYLNNVYRKNLIEREATKADEAKAKEMRKAGNEVGRIESWMKNATSDFFWRFYAGLQGSIKKVRVVVVQDGVEVGCIIQSIEVCAGKDGVKIEVSTEENSTSEQTADFSSDMKPPENFVYESGYDDGEHVDKTIKLDGLGLFVRKAVSMATVPKTLQFSSSVAADDYILQPGDLGLSYSFFYPFPPERRKKRSIETQSLGTNTTVASTDSTTSTKRRRGKRERAPTQITRTNSLENLRRDLPKREIRRNLSSGSLSPSRQASLRRTFSATGSATPSGRKHRVLQSRRGLSSEEPNELGVQSLHVHNRETSKYAQSNRFSSARSIKSGVSLGTTGRDVRSVLESPSVIAERPIQPVPKIDCRVNFEDVRVIFSNRHFELLSYFASTVQRVRNGRPKTTIRSVRELYITATMPKDLRVEYEEAAEKEQKTAAQSKLSSFLSPFQLKSLRSNDEENVKEKGYMKVEVSTAPVLSPRSVVVRQWWKYVSSAVLWEIRKKKHRRRNFLEMYVSFDWERQRYRRQEYINLYISTKLDKGWQSEVWPFEEDREEKLLQIEDELPLEQILLYRSIARSLHVKGISKMPPTVLETYSATPNFRAKNGEERRQKKVLERQGQDPRGSNLIDLLRNKYESTKKARLESLVTGKTAMEESYATGGGMSDGARHSSGIYYPGSFAADGNSAGGNRSLGNAFQAGNFYASGENRRDSRAGPRTITTRGKDSVHQRQTVVGSVVGQGGNVDSRMRLAVSLQVKCIDLMVVEDDLMFEPLDDLGKSETDFGRGVQLDTADFLDDESSSDQVSDLSVLTDDQNFFDEGSIGTIIEEGEEDGMQARLSSTDFLTFGRPDNIVLRTTVSQLGCSLRGISGAASQVRMHIGEIDLVDGNELVLFSIGSEVSAPVSEVNLSSTTPLRRRHRTGMDDSFRTSSSSDAFMPDSNLLARARAVDRAVSLVVNLDEGFSAASCDIAKFDINTHLRPVERLLLFRSQSKVTYPRKLVPVTSRDAARKLMLKRIANSSRFGANISIALRLHGMQLNVPFAAHSEVASSSSTSSSSRYSASSRRQLSEDQDSRLTFVVDTLELYTGRVVEEMCAQEDQGFAGNSVASGFKNKISTLKNVEMINIVGLTGLHDSFDCNHWVASISGIDCYVMTGEDASYNLCEMPIDTEILLTANGMPLLETESPKHKLVIESSPLHLLLSERRLTLLSNAFSTIGDTKLTAAGVPIARDPDPPRIEILSNRILHSIDVSCAQIKFDLVRDDIRREELSVEAKVLVMEEALSDFLSVGACFDFDLPNEEALSSAMQVCIGRLVGLGFSDDEAWGCVNSARLNFLDDVAQMRHAHDEALVHISASLRKESSKSSTREENSPVHGGIGQDEFENSETESRKLIAEGDDQHSLSSHDITESDDDSAESAGIVEMTITDAVEKTVTMFSPLLEEYQHDGDDSSPVLSIELPLGLRLSLVKLFYDQHLTFNISSIVVANRAGIEILTLVPYSNEDHNSNEIDEQEEDDGNSHSVNFSRFDFDKSYDFGSGGLPISVLGSDEGANDDLFFRERARFDDVELGELEFLFSSIVLEDVFCEIFKLAKNKKSSSFRSIGSEPDHLSSGRQDQKLELSTVVVASCLSVLFASDELVPFSRMTIEDLTYKNQEALRPLHIRQIPSWTVLAQSFVLQNLSPEGQFYPDVLGPLIQNGGDIPFQVRYHASSNTESVRDQLEIEFTEFRVYLLRNFIYELLHFFGHEKHGLGRLKANILGDRVDVESSQKEPLSILVKLNDSSIICPRSSACSDMVAFEVSEGTVVLSHVEETFAMPTEETPFDANPRNEPTGNDQGGSFTFEGTWARGHNSENPEYSLGSPVKSIRRTSINLNGVRAFTAIAESKEEREHIEDPLFRFVHEVDESVDAGKLIYRRKDTIGDDMFLEVKFSEQRWEEISTVPLHVTILADYAPHLRLLISNCDSPLPFALDARMSQLCLLISIWDSNMQEMPTMFPFTAEEIETFATPPAIPASFPQYGTDAFIKFLEDHSSVRSEICCLFKRVKIRCTYDSPGRYSVDPYCFRYFKNPGCDKKDRQGMVLTLGDAAIHIMNDHLNVKRIALGASSIELIDERRPKAFRCVMKNNPSDNSRDGRATSSAWANLHWGLRDDIRHFSSDHQVPVMFTVFMTPGWSLINIGMQDIDGVMHDLSWLWVLLEYFKSYYTNGVFGNPAFYSLKWAHRLKNSIKKANGKNTSVDIDQVGRNIDVRLWLRRPVLCLPSDYGDPQAPSLRLHSRSGMWYRYKSLQDFSSQEVASTDLNLFFVNEFQPPEMYRQKDVRGTMSSQPIVEGLSFGLRYDYNNSGNHTDCSVLIPYAGEGIPSLEITGEELEVPPMILSPPTVCTPYKPIERNLGPRVCELTAIIEVMPIVSSTLVNFFTGPSKVNEEFVAEEEDPEPQTFSISAAVKDVRVFALDPVLGAQLPVAVLSISSVSVTATQFATKPSPETADEVGVMDPPPGDLHVVADCSFWADYFKLGLTRSWEPLLEPFQCLVLYERSQGRGQGVSIDADTPFHLNLTGAVLQVLGDTVDSFSTLIKETFSSSKTKQNRVSNRVSMSMVPTAKAFAGAMAHDETTFHDGRKLSVVHETPRPLKRDDRVAFSLCNMTGQRIRIHQQSDTTLEKRSDIPAILTYLNQAASVGLTFAATISVIKNLAIQEVAYPGFANSQSNNHNEGSLNQAIDIQVPGFRWLQGVRVDSFGRKFQALLPRSEKIQLKINRDWRLRNALMLLTEVGFASGGRLVKVRSPFEIRNTTNHPIKLVFHPDPRYQPIEKTERDSSEYVVSRNSVGNETIIGDEDVQTIQPGESVPIPTLLLEKSLQLTGSHLGCFWLCPETQDTNISRWDFVTRNEAKGKEIHSSFCSRPVQLARIVHESSLLFKNGSGQDVAGDDAKTGIQVSCATRLSGGEVGAPFCYALEVGRSPLVKHEQNLLTDDSLDERDLALQGVVTRDPSKEMIHSPVAYTLSIHAPIVVVNLLPEGGRFELMHAINRTVLWFADLEPGQQIAVHSVGLDSPLLLLVNLGFCRTPVGEGALIHHGVDSPLGGEKEHGVRFKAIGKAAIQGTKQIGKTLTAMSDSPDKRGRGKLAEVNAAQFSQREKRKRKSKRQSVVKATDQSLGLDTSIGGMAAAEQGKVHAVESAVYSSNDVATSTTVVDSVGQRLTLSIENVRGGGGQRRISLFCPFWIVNNTEHALRYRQDKTKSFASGTVISPERDGSRPVDGSNRNYQNLHKIQSARRNMSQESIPMNTKTIFSGTHGSLATSPGRCELPPSELAELIEKDIPLQKLADLAFMFNFNDELSIGNAMLSVQLYDGTVQSNYKSDWSRGVSLDSVGYYQIVGMHCKDGRSLELSVEVNVAPGFLSPYTKIVRFLPRYVVFNRLERPVRLWQDSSVFRPVNEDRGAATTETLQSSKLSRKWRYDFEESNHHGKINQYESLFGKPATIDDRKCNKASVIRGAETISEGTTAHKSAQYIASVGPSELAPFSLPDSRAERQFRVDLGGMWNVTSSFSSELPGEHNLKISRATDLSLLKHVSTRAAPKYKIVLPPPDDATIGEWDGELGVFFETDWGGDRTIIVKGTKRGKYAYNHTDIHVGDELLRVDGVSVVRMSFAETMKLIKERLAYVASVRKQEKDAEKQPKRGLRRLSLGPSRRFSAPFFKQSSYEEGSNAKPAHLTLTFRTFEERLRKLRLKAGTGDGNLNLNLAQRRASGVMHPAKIEGISVEMKSWHNTMFVVIREQDKDNPLFRIQNRSINHIVFYRQRGCNGHPWNHLMPGESKPYSWEEPMKTKKLSVRVAAKAQDIFKLDGMMGSQEAFSDVGSEGDGEATEGESDKHGMRAARLAQALAHQFVDNEERGGYGPSISVRLEEIGYRSLLPIHAKDGGRSRRFLNCEVDTDGGTRLLVVSDDSGSVDERVMLKRHLDTLKKQIVYEQDRISELHSQKFLFSQIAPDFAGDGTPNENNGRAAAVESNAARLVDDFPEESTINCRHQIVVEVIEAIGLNVSDFVGSCNPYCEVFLKGRSKSRKYFFQKRKNKRQTYYIQKSLNPRWTDQVFVYDVPEEAVSVTRGYTLQVKLRNFRLVGQHPILGQASVHFGSLRNQQELVGWYPLSGSRSGQRDGDAMQISDSSRGSIKLRVQWIYAVPALLDYFLLISQRRLNQLMKSREGMTTQLAHAVESERNRREAMDQLSSGRIQNLVKLQRKKGNGRKITTRNEVEREKVVEKLNHGLNSGLSQLKDTLKTSRDKYLYALYYQTVESRRNRLEKKDGTTQRIPGHAKSSKKGASFALKKSKKSIENYIVEKASGSKRISYPSNTSPSPEKFQNNRRALNNFFKLQKHRSISRLSLVVDDNSIEGEDDVENVDKWDSGKVIYDGLYSQDRGMSEMMASGANDSEEAGKTQWMLQQLLLQGFLFHECGVFFHREHLPRRFRKTLFAQTGRPTNTGRQYRPKHFVGSGRTIRHFRSWQFVYAVYWDPEFQIDRNHDMHILATIEKAEKPEKAIPAVSKTRFVIMEKLAVPDDAPPTLTERARGRADTMYMSRLKFERACKRILGSVLNPGGWLTIRPITVLNLPDTFTGMFVKLRYGSEVLMSETVDARVTPRWSTGDIFDAQQEATGGFKFSNNDLHVRVEPQQTSGSIMISVVAEKMNSKTELGVLQLPLGDAIAACIDSGEELFESTMTGEAAGQAMYVRWFPLMEPRMAEQVEGDMGLSSRPVESEKLRDNMFEQYFTPCIQLALIWWPDSNDSKNESEHRASTTFDVSQRQTGPDRLHKSATPMIENYFNADISRISAALIDSQRALELLSFAAIDIDVRYSVSKTKTRVGLVVGWIQIDHQDSRAREPVVLAPTPMEDLQPTLQFLALRDNVKTKSNIISYEYLGLYLQEMDLVVEEFWLFELWEFVMGVLRRSQVKRSTTEGRELADALSKMENCFVHEADDYSHGPSLLTILQDAESNAASSSKKKFYIEQLILGLVKINLSYMKGKKHSWEMADFTDQEALIKTLDLAATTRNKANANSKSEQSDAFQRWSQHTFDEDLFAETGGDGSNHLPAIIAAVFPSVSDASIRLQGKAIEHVFESPGEIFSSIKNFYVNETLKQVYKIIGSIDFVGNPTSIISSFVSGVRDLVVVPATAIMRSPTDVNQVGIEVAKGTISFFSHSTSGIFSFLAKMSASAGQTVAILSLDSEYRQWHRDTVVSEATDLNRVWKRRGMQNASKIVLRPVRDILFGVAMGASGLVVSPYKGFKKGGPLGLVRGIATGTAGVVAKPIVGVLDAFTHVSATMHDAARSANILERRYQPSLKLRLPYTFGPMKILAPFDTVTARAMYLLKEFPPKTKRSKVNNGRSAELHIHSEVLNMEKGVDTFAIVSTLRVVLIKLKRENMGLSPSFGWEVSLAEPSLVTSLISDHGHNGVALTITKSREEKELSISEKTKQSGKPSIGGPILKTSSIHSSALSLDSRDSFADSAIAGMHREPFSESIDLEDRDDPNYKYGLTRKQGEILEWFTVLAEFQHRMQLTRLHNAICCVVRDLDAVVVDRASGVDHVSRNYFTFGLYSFGAGSSDSLTSSRCNVDAIAALEQLPWMQDSTFNMVRNMPEQRQVEEVAKLRQSWMFSRELEASTKQGGPRWLIEARARAMFVPTNPPALLEYLDTHDPVVEKVHWEWKQGNISSEQASQLLEAHNELISIPSAYDDDSDHGILQMGKADVDSDDEDPQTELASAERNDDPILSVNGESEVTERRNSSESFYSAQLEHSTNLGDAVEVVEVPRSERTFVYFQDNVNRESDGDKVDDAGNRQLKNPESRPEFSKLSKVDRMEALLEQLIILNVNQATKPAPGFSMVAPAVQPESRIADTMLNELLALRSEIQYKTKKDEDLQKEIALLRQQLAQGDSKTGTDGKIGKLRHLFGVGTKDPETKKSNIEGGEKHIAGNQSRALQSKSIQFSKGPPHTLEGMPAKGGARRRASSFDGSHESLEFPLNSADRDFASAMSLDSSFRSEDDGLGGDREGKYPGASGDLSAQFFDRDGLNGFFLPEEPGGSINPQKEEKNKKKATKLKKIFHFGKKNRTTTNT